MERIVPDPHFQHEKLPQAEMVFWIAIMPELLGKWFSRENMTTIPKVQKDSTKDTNVTGQREGEHRGRGERRGGRERGK